MSAAQTSTRMFHYRAQAGGDGKPFAGAIEAADSDEARQRLTKLGLWVIELEPEPAAPRARPLRGDEFLAFNQQLAHLAKAGMPIEQGLRLIAQDMRSGRLAAVVRQVADDLDRGTPLAQAFESRRKLFPPLYGRIIDAGVKSNRLADMLLNLGRHLDMVQRMRMMMWQTLAYPVVVLFFTALVVAFLQATVLPNFHHIFDDFVIPLPTITQWVMAAGGKPGLTVLAVLVGAAAAAVVIFFSLPREVRLSTIEALALPTPLLGRALRANLMARWCDALRLGVEAGLDLPAAVDLAGQSLLWPTAQRDSRRLAEQLREGKSAESLGDTSLIPATVLAALGLSASSGGLPQTLATLAQMYQQQAEIRINTFQAAMTPILVIFLGVIIGVVVLALFMPLMALLSNFTGGRFGFLFFVP